MSKAKRSAASCAIAAAIRPFASAARLSRPTVTANWRWPSGTGRQWRRLSRLAKFQHVDVDRLGGGMRWRIASVLRHAEEIAAVSQFEPRGLDFRGDQGFVGTVQGLDDAGAGAGLGGVIAHNEFATRLQRFV